MPSQLFYQISHLVFLLHGSPLPPLVLHLSSLITGKTTLTESLREALGARLLQSPPQCLSPWRAVFDREPPLIRRAFYALGNYITAEQMGKEASQAPVIVDRYEAAERGCVATSQQPRRRHRDGAQWEPSHTHACMHHARIYTHTHTNARTHLVHTLHAHARTHTLWDRVGESPSLRGMKGLFLMTQDAMQRFHQWNMTSVMVEKP